MTQSTDTTLSDTRLILLSAASQRDDGSIPIHERLKGAVATRAGERLVDLGVAEERPAEPGQPIWREAADGERWTLIITRRGMAAIGVDEPVADGEDGDPATPESPSAAGQSLSASVDAPKRSPRPGSKKALVIERLHEPEGASIDDIAGATGWQAHTIRSFLTGLRKAGMAIETIRQTGEPTRYRLMDGEDAGAGAGAGAGTACTTISIDVAEPARAEEA